MIFTMDEHLEDFIAVSILKVLQMLKLIMKLDFM